jgi:hypothetical protein
MKTFNGYRRHCGLWLFCAAYAAVPVAAQQQQEAPPQTGFFIRETSIYSTYYSVGIPPSLIASGLASSAGADAAFAGSTAFAYVKQTERTTMSLLYTPSYSRRVRYSDWSAFNNSLDLNFSRSITPRLDLLFTGAGAVRNREDFQFNPVSGTPPAGTPAPPRLDGEADPATQSLLFGSRILTANARLGVNYAITPRLSFTSGVGSNRSQYLRASRDENLQQTTAVIPQVTSVMADMGVDYSLSPQTSIGARISSNRQQSRIQDVLISNARFEVQHALTRRWSVGGYGGMGQFRTLTQSLGSGPSNGRLQYIGGGNATFQTLSHTISGSFDRRISDLYGLGSSSSSSINGLWNWARPNSRFWTSVGFGRTQLNSIGLPVTTWRGSGMIGRRISNDVAITATYSYMAYANTLIQQSGMFEQNSVRVGVTWTGVHF